MKYLTMNDAMKMLGVTNQAVYIAIRYGKLKAMKKEGKWVFLKKDISDYGDNRYCRTRAKDKEGNLIYDKEKGFYSPREAAEYLGVRRSRLYYLIYSGVLPAKRVGVWGYVLKLEDMEKGKLLMA